MPSSIDRDVCHHSEPSSGLAISLYAFDHILGGFDGDGRADMGNLYARREMRELALAFYTQKCIQLVKFYMHSEAYQFAVERSSNLQSYIHTLSQN